MLPAKDASAGVRVKICGLTRLEDAQLAARLGAWALGFVFYPPSPRAIRPEAAAGLIAALPAAPAKIGVFVNAEFAELRAIADQAGLTHLQLHGEESPELVAQLQQAGYQVIKAQRLRRREDLSRLARWPQPLLIDAIAPGVWGGSGQLADWELASAASAQGAVILAGGLTPENLMAAISTVKPWGVDLSSGVEAAPGIKDHAKLEALFASLPTAEGQAEKRMNTSMTRMKARGTYADPD